MKRGFVFVLCVAAMLPVSSGAAQISNGWWPRLVDLKNPPAPVAVIMQRNLLAAEQLLLRTSGYARPKGFEAQMQWASTTPRSDDRRWDAREHLRSYWVEIHPFVPTRESAGGAYTERAYIRFNPEFGLLAEGAVESESGEIYFLERVRSERRYGATVVYGNFGAVNDGLLVLFTVGDRDPFLPVTREEYLRAQMHNAAPDAKALDSVQRSATKTPYQEWMEGAPQRKAEREAALAQLRGILPAAEIDAMRKMQEATEREVTQQLRQRESEDQGNLRKLGAIDPLAPLREELAAMSPAERASPAWAAGVSLMPANAPAARRVMRVDPFFLRAPGSLASPRAILVRIREPSLGLEQAQTQLFQELDWAAVKALLAR